MGSKLHLFRSQIIKKSGLKFVFIRVYARTDNIFDSAQTDISIDREVIPAGNKSRAEDPA
jgi:hypothetical protein